MENKNQRIDDILKSRIENIMETSRLPDFNIKDSEEYIIISFTKYKSYMNKENYIRTIQESFKQEIENYVKNIKNT